MNFKPQLSLSRLVTYPTWCYIAHFTLKRLKCIWQNGKNFKGTYCTDYSPILNPIPV